MYYDMITKAAFTWGVGIGVMVVYLVAVLGALYVAALAVIYGCELFNWLRGKRKA